MSTTTDVCATFPEPAEPPQPPVPRPRHDKVPPHPGVPIEDPFGPAPILPQPPPEGSPAPPTILPGEGVS
jgi:hypothetical protein